MNTSLTKRIVIFAGASAFALNFACGSDDAPPTNNTQRPVQCDSATYVAFDPANHANQDLRVQAYEDMGRLMDEATEMPALAAAKFGEAEMLYMNTAELRTKVQGRKDVHLADQPNIGMELDATIMAGFAAGKAATTSLEADLAKEKVEKTLDHFFFLSIYYEMTEGGRKEWDEAYGYYASGASNAEASRKGFASIATKRDAQNGTTLASDIFNGLIDGSCELAIALRDKGGDAVDPKTVPALSTIIDRVDTNMQKVLAFYAGHEAFELEEGKEMMNVMATQELRDEMNVELVELETLFHAVEPIMIARGGDSAMRATRIRMTLDSAKADATGAWMLTMDAEQIVADLEAEYQIDIKG
jgi:hypothetical protein